MRNLKTVLALLAIALLMTLATQAVNGQDITVIDKNNTTNTAQCVESTNTCVLSITVSFKKGTALMSELVPSRSDSVQVTVNGTTLQAGYNTEGKTYYLGTEVQGTKVSDLRKAIRTRMRELLQ